MPLRLRPRSPSPHAVWPLRPQRPSLLRRPRPLMAAGSRAGPTSRRRLSPLARRRASTRAEQVVSRRRWHQRSPRPRSLLLWLRALRWPLLQPRWLQPLEVLLAARRTSLTLCHRGGADAPSVLSCLPLALRSLALRSPALRLAQRLRALHARRSVEVWLPAVAAHRRCAAQSQLLASAVATQRPSAAPPPRLESKRTARLPSKRTQPSARRRSIQLLAARVSPHVPPSMPRVAMLRRRPRARRSHGSQHSTQQRDAQSPFRPDKLRLWP